MPVSATQRTVTRTTLSSAADTRQTDWLTPYGVVVEPVQPRLDAPRFTYRGNADEHLRGQSCYAQPESLDDESVSVIMACGCRLTVPWWTLEPLTTR